MSYSCYCRLYKFSSKVYRQNTDIYTTRLRSIDQSYDLRNAHPLLVKILKSHDDDVEIMASYPLVVTPARASSQVEHGWRSHLVSEVTLAWPGAVTVKVMSYTVTTGKLLSGV